MSAKVGGPCPSRPLFSLPYFSSIDFISLYITYYVESVFECA